MVAGGGENCTLKAYVYMFSIQTCITTAVAYTYQRIFHTSALKPKNQCEHQQLCVNFLSRGQFCCIDGLKEGSKYAHWIGLYLSFHLSWVLGPFVYGRLQNLKT